MSDNNRFDGFDSHRNDDKNTYKNDRFYKKNTDFRHDFFDYDDDYNKNDGHWSSVDDLIDGGNFDNIGEKVEKAVDFAVNEALNSVFINSLGFGDSGKRFVRNMGEGAKKFIKNGSRQKRYEISDFGGILSEKKYSREIEKVIYRPKGFVLSILLQIVFYFLQFMCMLFAIVVLATNLVSPIWGILLLASSFLFMTGGLFSSLRFYYISRFRKYLDIIADEGFAYTGDISNRLKISQNKVISDLKKMTEKKNFIEGHLIEDDSIFLITDKLYGYYLDGISQREGKESSIYEVKANELKLFIDTCTSLSGKVKELGEKIEYYSMKQKSLEVCNLVDTIIDVVRENPDQLTVVSKFSTYYMPTTVKLFDSYYDFEKSYFENNEVEKSKKEIEGAIDSIVHAYKKILGEIFSVGTMDVNADISVLKSMLSQDGLMEENPFENKNDKKQGY